MASDDDRVILELALKAVSEHLNALVESCVGADKSLKTPDLAVVMRARAALPPYCSMAFKKS